MYERFERLLEERSLTAYRVAMDTGIASATLTEWKKGTYKPKVDKLLVLAKYFDVPLEYFLEPVEVTS